MITMKFRTRDFGEIDIDPGQTLYFRQPVFGFDEYRNYAVLHDPDAGGDIAWLQSLDEPDLCFVLVSPQAVRGGYHPWLPSGLGNLVGDGAYDTWLIAVIHEQLERSTVNLKSPVIIDRNTGLGAQVVLESNYPIRYPLMEEAVERC